MEIINFESIHHHYIGASESDILKAWQDEYNSWKENSFNSIHILNTYLKYSDVVQTELKREMFFVDKQILKDWVGEALSNKVSYRNLKEVNVFNLEDFYNYNFSKDFIDVLSEHALENNYNALATQSLLFGMEDVHKYYDNSFYKDILHRNEFLDSPDKLISVMSLSKTKSKLKGFFKLINDININVIWSDCVQSNKFNSPISNLNKVFINYLQYGSSDNSDKGYFDFYMDKRKELLPEQKSLEIKNDFKFFLATSRVKSEDVLINALKEWPKVVLTKADMQENITPKNSLEKLLLVKANWRVLHKYSSLLSITDLDILSANLKQSDARLSRTSSAVIALLNNSKDDDNYYKFMNSFLSRKNKTSNPIVIEHLISLTTGFNVSDKLKNNIQEYLKSRNYENENLKNMWEDFNLLTLDKLTYNDWMREDKNGVLLQKYLNEHIKILGSKSYSVFSGSKSFFAKPLLKNVEQTKLKDILFSLNTVEKCELIKNMNNFWEDNDIFFQENFSNSAFINDDVVAVSNLIIKIESFVIWMSPSNILENYVSQLEKNIAKYKDIFIKSLENKQSLSFPYDKNNVIQELKETSILWEKMRMNMLVSNNKLDVKPIKF